MDKEFYERRIAEERAAALRATDPVVRKRHEELADLYVSKLTLMSRRPVLKMVFEKSSERTAS